MTKVSGVKYVGFEEQHCISVDAPDGLYVTDEGILTHNSIATIFCQVLCATSQKKSSELLAEPFVQLLEQSPFFMKVRTHQEMLAANRDFEATSEVNKMPWTTSAPTSVIQIANGVNYMLISNANGLLGQAQPLDSLVVMADGTTKTMGEVAVGDEVKSPVDGKATVLGVFPQGETDCYELEFDDGRRVRCSGEHLWVVSWETVDGGPVWNVVDTLFLLENDFDYEFLDDSNIDTLGLHNYL